MTSAPREFPVHSDVIVVGAGAAGLATAIFARRLRPDRSVLVVDGAVRPGAKILVSGGARCNVTNVSVADDDFWGGRRTIIRRVLRAFPSADAAAFFRALGVPLHEEADGKLFPDSNRARDVLDALLRELAARGASLRTGERVHDVRRTDAGFAVLTARAEFHARRVVLATGGLSLPKSGSDGAGIAIAARLGHSVVPTTPALAPLVLADEEPLHQLLSGVAQDVELAMWVGGRIVIRLTGAMLWTHFGVSGPVALNMSRHWLRAVAEDAAPVLTVNLLGASFEQADAQLSEAVQRRPRASLKTILSALLPASVASAVVDAFKRGESNAIGAQLSREDRRRLVRDLVERELPVVGSRGYTVAEATAGGIALSEINPGTMESRVCPGLFLVGEMLDVDGRLGGFNFQWAWSSAYVAALGLSRDPSPARAS